MRGDKAKAMRNGHKKERNSREEAVKGEGYFHHYTCIYKTTCEALEQCCKVLPEWPQTCSVDPPSPFFSLFCNFSICRSTCQINDPTSKPLWNRSWSPQLRSWSPYLASHCCQQLPIRILPPQGKQFWPFPMVYYSILPCKINKHLLNFKIVIIYSLNCKL